MLLMLVQEEDELLDVRQCSNPIQKPKVVAFRLPDSAHLKEPSLNQKFMDKLSAVANPRIAVLPEVFACEIWQI